MGDYIRRGKRIGEVTVTAVTSSDSTKRRKIDSQEVVLQKSSSSHNVELKNQYRHVVNLPQETLSPTVSGTSDHVTSSFCSTSVSKQEMKDGFKTLKVESDGTKISTFSNDCFSRETIPTSELCADSVEMESPTSKKKPAATKIPSAEEIEEFFCVAEKYEQKRFADKYNYDIVKDVPMEGGRYQWVRLKP